MDDVAVAAGVPAVEAWRLVALGQAVVSGREGLVSTADAVRLVKILRGEAPLSPNRVPFNQLPPQRRRAARIVGFAGLFYGLQGMRVGGTRTLRIAPHLGYGEQGVPGVIPANALLTVEVTVLSERPEMNW